MIFRRFITTFAVLFVLLKVSVAGTPSVARKLTTKPFAGSAVSVLDVESLTYNHFEQTLWFGDDDGGAVYGFSAVDGAFVKKIAKNEFSSAFPDAGSAYLQEFEIVTYDTLNNEYYMINTVNTPGVDLPAIYRFSFSPTDQTTIFDSWAALPSSFKFERTVFINDTFFVSDPKSLFAYDTETYSFVSPNNAVYTATSNGGIAGLSFRGGHLWILYYDYNLHVVNWRDKSVIDSYNLSSFGIGKPKGLEVVGNEILVVDGDAPNEIYVFSLDEWPYELPVSAGRNPGQFNMGLRRNHKQVAYYSLLGRKTVPGRLGHGQKAGVIIAVESGKNNRKLFIPELSSGSK